MTKADKFKASMQAGKVIRKDLVQADGWFMDTVMETCILRQEAALAESEARPRAIINIDYFEVKDSDVVFDRKTKKPISSERPAFDQEEDLVDDLKKPAGSTRKAPSKPGPKKKSE